MKAKTLNFAVNGLIRDELQKHGVKAGLIVSVHQDSYEHFIKSIRSGGYERLSADEQQALAIGCCYSHPNHKQAHMEPIRHPIKKASSRLASALRESTEYNIYSVLTFRAVVIALLLLILASVAHCQGTSQIDVIQFQNSSGVPIKSFAAPFKIKCSTNVTCAASGSVLTITASGTGGGGGYATIQNGGVAIAQEAAINFLGSFSCVDNPGNGSSDCKLNTNAAVTNQYFTGIDSSGNFIRKQIAYGELSGVPSTFAPTAHNLLSASHGDTTAASAVRGDGIFAIGATPTWQRLAHPTASGGYYKWNGTDIVASAGAASGTGSPTGCTGQVVTAFTLNGDAAPTSTCTSLTGAFLPVPGSASLGGVDAKDCTGTGHVLSINTDGSVTCSADAGGGGGSTPTGTGFTHITSGVQDSAAKTIDVSSADITGTLKAVAEPAHTGDVTNTAGSLALAIAAGAVTRADLASDALGMQFLGSTTPLGSANATLGPLTLIAKRKHMQIRGFIASYAANGVGGMQLANVTTIDTGADYAVQYISAATTTVTAATSVSAIAIRVSNTLATAGRSFIIDIDDYGTGQIKRAHGRTNSISTSSGTAPTQDVWEALWSNTTAGIGAIQFTALSSLTAGTATTTTFGTGSYFTVWGRDDN